MPYQQYGVWPDDPERPFYNLRTVVVPGAVGADVMLLQWLLRLATMAYWEYPGQGAAFRLETEYPMVIDGVYGTRTRQWMLVWERFMRQVQHEPIVPDGIIRPWPAGDTNYHRKIYQLNGWALNSTAEFWYDSNLPPGRWAPPEAYMDMPNFAGTPAALRAHLRSGHPPGA